MASIRQQQLASSIQRSLGDLFIRQGSRYYGGAFVTVTRVSLTPDLSIARIYLSVYNVSNKQEIIDLLSENVKDIRYHIGNQIRNKVRRIPELEFYLDDTLDEVFHLEQLFEGLEIPKEEEE